MKKSIYTVTQVNTYIKNMFQQDYLLGQLSVSGEVSNCKYHSSGHIYFTLKEKGSLLQAVMFAGNRGGLSFQMKEGQRVVVTGSVSIYERDGKYQLYAKQIELEGVGSLYEKYEALKKELEERGMFAAQYKRPIPPYVHTLGVVTASTGAAVRDIITVSKRRNPYIRILLYPAKVQGEGAADTIAAGIACLEAAGVDCIIVGRGGGSIEDLWAFNEETTAEAIFNCRVPVISGVGHETDFTIADFTADLRAATPSQAAELAVFDHRAFITQLETYQRRLTDLQQAGIWRARQRLENDRLRLLKFRPDHQVAQKRLLLDQLQDRFQAAMEAVMDRKKHALAMYAERLKGLSPLDRITGGYAFVMREDGSRLDYAGKTAPGETIMLQMSDGQIRAEVLEVWKKDTGKDNT